MKDTYKFIVGLGLSLALTVAVYSSDLVKGVDFTGLQGASSSQLNNLVDNATPASWIGFVIVTNAAPNISLHPRYTNFVWLNTSNGYPASMMTYDGTNWNASEVGLNTITTAMLQDLSVVEAKIGNGAVTTAKLANNSVDLNKIIAGNVNSTHMAANAVHSSVITNLAILQSHITNGAVGTAQLIDLEVTRAKLAVGSVNSTILTNGAVITSSIADNVVTNVHMTADAIRSTNIVDATIAAVDLAADILFETYDSGTNNALPSATSTSVAHGLTGLPQHCRVVFVNVTTQGGYNPGDELDLSFGPHNNGVTYLSEYSWSVDGSNVVVANNTTGGSIVNKGGGGVTAFTAANWKFRVYATYFK